MAELTTPQMEDLDHRARMLEIQNADEKADAQKQMTWFALIGMLVYPIGIIIADAAGLQQSVTTLGDIAPTYFIAVSAVVGTFFGMSAYMSKGK